MFLKVDLKTGRYHCPKTNYGTKYSKSSLTGNTSATLKVSGVGG